MIHRTRRKKHIKALQNGDYITPGRAPLGLDEQSNEVVYRYSEEAVQHTLMSGSAGSGKTTTLLSMALSNILNGESVVMLDFDRSSEVAAKLAAWSAEEEVDFYHFVNDNPATYDVEFSNGPALYDPLALGSVTEKIDKVFAMCQGSEDSEVYETTMRQVLHVLFTIISYGKEQRTRSEGSEQVAPDVEWDNGDMYLLYSVVSNTTAFQQLVEVCKNTPIGHEARALYEQIHGETEVAHTMSELAGQLRTIIMSEYGQWMHTADPEHTIDLTNLARDQQTVVLFSLDSDNEAVLAQWVGSMVFTDLKIISSKRLNVDVRNTVNVYVDSFSRLNPDVVQAFLEQARESRMALTLSQQSFEQITTTVGDQGEEYLDFLLENCSNVIAFAGMSQQSATKLSALLGKTNVQVQPPVHQGGRFLPWNWSRRPPVQTRHDTEERWVVDPAALLHLSKPNVQNTYRSTAVVLNKSIADPEYAAGTAVARTVWMIPDRFVLVNYHTWKIFDA